MITRKKLYNSKFKVITTSVVQKTNNVSSVFINLNTYLNSKKLDFEYMEAEIPKEVAIEMGINKTATYACQYNLKFNKNAHAVKFVYKNDIYLSTFCKTGTKHLTKIDNHKYKNIKKRRIFMKKILYYNAINPTVSNVYGWKLISKSEYDKAEKEK